jgi:hypothetical protein
MHVRSISYPIAVVFLVTLGLPPSTGLSANLTYSWSGHIRLFDETSPDPWLIGSDGAEFTLHSTVSTTATDFNPTQVPFAVFEATTIRLWVNGEETLFVGNGQIDFTDTIDVLDLISAGGTFSKLGQTVEISSVVGIAPAAFSFTNASESPPLFEPTNSMTIGGSGRSPYFTVVSSGVLVTVVPEPTSSIVAMGSILIMSGIRMRRRFR